MRQGTIYIQDQKRESLVKGSAVIFLLVGLWVSTLLPGYEMLVLAVLVVWVVGLKWMMKSAEKKSWFHKTASWTLTETELTIDGQVFSRDRITKVTCLPKSGLQRKSLRSWVLTVETWEKSYRWVSQTQFGDSKASIQSLQQLGNELGCSYPFFMQEG